MPKAKQRMPFAWRPVAIYLAIVAVAGVGLVIWDRAYEARRESLDAPRPEVVAKNLVENVVGPRTVRDVVYDRGSDTVTLTVNDVVTGKGKTPAQDRELLTGEGTQAVTSIQGLVTFKHIVLKLVKDGKLLATVRSDAGKAPQLQFAPGIK